MPAPSRSGQVPLVLWAGAVLCLAGCAETAKKPEIANAPPPFEQPVAKPHRSATRAKRVETGCQAAKVELSDERKEALFRQFDAEIGPVPTAVPAPAPLPECRQAAR